MTNLPMHYFYIAGGSITFTLLFVLFPYALIMHSRIKVLKTKFDELEISHAKQMEELKEVGELLSIEKEEHQVGIQAFRSIQDNLAYKNEQLNEKGSEIREMKKLLAESQLNLKEAQIENQRIVTKQQEQSLYHQKAVKDLQDTKTMMTKEFSLLANQILEEKGKSFSEQSEKTLSQVLKPFKQELHGFREKVEAIQKEEIRQRGSLQTELKHLRELNQQITDDADNLTKALKGEKKLQGNWGEIQLERLLETSGLIKGQEFEREPNYKDEEGKNKRPDFIVHLPEGKHLIIDSKVSLNAYLEFCESDDAEQQAKALKKHVQALKQHIINLNGKNYSSLHGIQSPDFVFMFMPIEPAFNLALQADFKMFEDAFQKHIVIVTPTTLLATLKTVASIWTIEKQNAKSAELAAKAANVYDKLRTFLEKMEKLDTQINTTRNTFDDAMKSLRNGNGNLVRQAEQFKELGVRVKKDISETVLAKSDLSIQAKIEAKKNI